MRPDMEREHVKESVKPYRRKSYFSIETDSIDIAENDPTDFRPRHSPSAQVNPWGTHKRAGVEPRFHAAGAP